MRRRGSQVPSFTHMGIYSVTIPPLELIAEPNRLDGIQGSLECFLGRGELSLVVGIPGESHVLIKICLFPPSWDELLAVGDSILFPGSCSAGTIGVCR